MECKDSLCIFILGLSIGHHVMMVVAMQGTIWCLHGAVGMAEDWKDLKIPGWATKRVDLWRFLDCCPMSMEEFGKALNREAKATSGTKVLLGYSMGGRLGLHALLENGPWDAAVIISAHPGLKLDKEKVARRAQDAEWSAKALKADWSEFLDKWNGQVVLKSGDKVAMKIADRSKLEMRRASVARSFIDWSLGNQADLSERLAGIDCPLLWVAGEHDAKFRALAEHAVESGGFESWMAPDVGHRVPWESQELATMMGEFLERAVS